MITIVATSTLLEGQKENFLNMAAELLKKSRMEPGNLSYCLYEDQSNSNSVAFIEEWKDQQAIEAHNASEHFKRVVPLLNQFRVAPSKVVHYNKIDV